MALYIKPQSSLISQICQIFPELSNEGCSRISVRSRTSAARVERLKNAQINARGGHFRYPSQWHASHVSRLCTSLDVHRLGGLSLNEQAPLQAWFREREKKNVDTGRRGLACKRNGVEWWRGKGIGKVGRGTGMLPEKGTVVGGEKSKGRTRTER